MTVLRPEIRAFLHERYPDARVSPITGDASTRSFYRLTTPLTSWVLMDYGSAFQGETDDVRLSRIFERAGLPVARIAAVAPEAGCLVLEDLGDRTLQVAFEKGEVRELYERAVDLAAEVAARGTPVLASSERAAGPSLDEERFRFEMDFFVEHFVLGLRRIAPPPALLREELHSLASRTAAGARVLCHRDYHSRNLMVRPDGSLAMVDIQDARWGPDTYDLASLLHDAYVEIPATLVNDLITRHRNRIGSAEPSDAFRARFDLVAAQRMIKALGTFGFQTVVRRSPYYLSAIPRTLQRLEETLPHLPETLRLHTLFRDLGLYPVDSAG